MRLSIYRGKSLSHGPANGCRIPDPCPDYFVTRYQQLFDVWRKPIRPTDFNRLCNWYDTCCCPADLIIDADRWWRPR